MALATQVGKRPLEISLLFIITMGLETSVVHHQLCKSLTSRTAEFFSYVNSVLRFLQYVYTLIDVFVMYKRLTSCFKVHKLVFHPLSESCFNFCVSMQ